MLVFFSSRRRHTRSNKKETDGIRRIRDPTRKRLTGYTADTRSNEKLCQCLSDWCGYDIQRVRDLFRNSADYKRQRTNIYLCNKRLVWRCGGEDKETLVNAKRLYSS